MAAPLLKRFRLLGAGLEGATPGVPVALGSLSQNFVIFDPELTYDPEIQHREWVIGAAFGEAPAQVVKPKAQLRFKMELYASAAMSGICAAFLTPCGIALSGGSYVMANLPVGATGSMQQTASFALYQNGMVEGIYGAMGNVKLIGVAGEKVTLEMQYQGIYGLLNGDTVVQDAIDAAIPTAVITPSSPTRFVDSGLLLGDWTPVVKQLTLDYGNTVVLREDSTSPTGLAYAIIVNRLPKVTIDPEKTLIAVNDLRGIMNAATEQELSFACNSGNASVAFATSHAQIVGVKPSDRDQTLVDSVDLQINRMDLAFTVNTGS